MITKERLEELFKQGGVQFRKTYRLDTKENYFEICEKARELFLGG